MMPFAQSVRVPRARRAMFVELLLPIVLVCSVAAAQAQQQTLDDFSSLAQWKVVAADGVVASIHPDTGPPGSGPCLRLDFEFVTGSGYCLIQRTTPLDLPENYEFAARIRAAPGTPENNLEFKLVDELGENVWWVNRRAFQFPTEWTRLSNKRRHFDFAWGPSAGKPITRLGRLEIAVASSTGGKGSLFIDDLTFRSLPPSAPYTGRPAATASSTESGTAATAAIDGDPSTGWRSGKLTADQPAMLTIDFGQPREFGGVVIDWEPSARCAAFKLLASDDGQQWQLLSLAPHAGAERSFIRTPDAQARFVRVEMLKPAEGASTIGIREVAVRPLEFGSSANAMYAAMAADQPQGRFPRYFSNQQCYWTVVGAPGDDKEGLLSEDGSLEVDKGAFSIEPFLFVNDKLATWADSAISQHLSLNYIPAPLVSRRTGDIELQIGAFADGPPGASTLYALYAVTNHGSSPIDASLFLAIRPFQVNPPWQSLNLKGGTTTIHSLQLSGDDLIVNGDRRVALLSPPAERTFGAAPFDAGDITDWLARGELPATTTVADALGLASGAVRLPVSLKPRESVWFAVAIPFHAAVDPGHPENARPEALSPVDGKPLGPPQVIERLRASWRMWDEQLNRVRFDLPRSARSLWDTARSQLGFILINRDGPAIQPGSRCYERSWARDGSMTSAALLEFGHPQEVREWIEWFASKQFDSGKVPCVVDQRGPDPVPENDSHGQLIFAIANYYRYTHDKPFLRAMWPHVQSAVEYIDSLRRQRMTGEFAEGAAGSRQEPGKRPVPVAAFYGLVPESISHEGYSAKPMHSYWDDYFVLLGLKEAAFIASALDDTSARTRYAAMADDMTTCLQRSIGAAMAAHDIDYLPGCVELGDFDATSTTVALWPCGLQDVLPHLTMARTFDKYWECFIRRRDQADFEWKDYTPYENRVIGSFIRLDQRRRAHALIDYFLSDRRPAAWNQWSEVVHRDPRAPGFIGDTPHTWVGSDFLNAFRSIFIIDRDTDAGPALVLLPGVPPAWLVEAEDDGVAFDDLPTPFGKLSCRAIMGRDDVVVSVTGDGELPPGGLFIADPYDAGRPPTRVDKLPGEVTIHRP